MNTVYRALSLVWLLFENLQCPPINYGVKLIYGKVIYFGGLFFIFGKPFPEVLPAVLLIVNQVNLPTLLANCTNTSGHSRLTFNV